MYLKLFFIEIRELKDKLNLIKSLITYYQDKIGKKIFEKEKLINLRQLILSDWKKFNYQE